MTHRPGPSGPQGVVGSPWLGLAARCTGASAAAAAVLAGVALAAAGPPAAGSVAFAASVVIAFFAISLLAGHAIGRRNPSGAIGAFAVVYVLKIVGFAALLLWLGRPGWVDGPWFGASGIVTVVVWQVVEVLSFSRLRLLIFGDSDGSSEEGPRG
ncbi:hypothetical protein [Sinomonas mesophila]|uniref:hypothetical protein n=1 Tax=Sinomonas mesophila TaxID=1531955 RepID=UPI000984F826|nr:hypothetical protein [Sinomonas mesophila]